MLKLALQKRTARVTNKREDLPVYSDSLTTQPGERISIEPAEPTSKKVKRSKRKIKDNTLDMLAIDHKVGSDDVDDVSDVHKPIPKSPAMRKLPKFNVGDTDTTLSVGQMVQQFTHNIENGTISNTLVHDPNVKLQNIEGTNFPRNTPCYICGPKGSGKTYMLSALLQYVVSRELYTRIFYVYADNVDATIHVAIPKDKLYLVSKEHAEAFLQKYLRKKTKYCSWLRFYNTVVSIGVESLLGLDIDHLLQTHIYWDNLIDETVKTKKLTSFDLMLEYCKKTLDKYQKSTIIKIANRSDTNASGFRLDSDLNEVRINVGPFSEDDFDMIVFDDIAQFFDLWGNTRSKSKLYKYFTITRQNRTTFYLCGQDLMQLQKMFREQLGALVCMVGTDTQELKTYRFNKKMITHIEDEMRKLSTHEGFLFNYNTQVLEIIKNGPDEGGKNKTDK